MLVRLKLDLLINLHLNAKVTLTKINIVVTISQPNIAEVMSDTIEVVTS